MEKPVFNEAAVRELASPAKGNRVTFFRGAIVEGRPLASGLGVRVTAGGAKAFVLQYRDGAGKQVRQTLGNWPLWSCVKAARRAHELRQALDRGEAIEAPKRGRNHTGTGKVETASDASKGPTVGSVLDDFIKRHVQPNLRDAKETERLLNKDVRPTLGTMAIRDVRRSDINRMLDAIEARGSKVTVDRTLAAVRKCFNWYAARGQDDTFVNPIVRGMNRSKPVSRERVLCRDRNGTGDDAELWTLWHSLEKPTVGEASKRMPACFPAYMKVLLLTAQRRSEVAAMRFDEIRKGVDGEPVWFIPKEKTKAKRDLIVPLSRQVQAIIEAEGRRAGHRTGFVFSTTGGTLAFNSHSKSKSALDVRMAEARREAGEPVMKPWTLHDLRRTARTLLSRSETVQGKEIPGVRPDIAERVLGHVIPGVWGIYDQADYVPEMRAVLQLLADRVERIVGW